MSQVIESLKFQYGMVIYISRIAKNESDYYMFFLEFSGKYDLIWKGTNENCVQILISELHKYTFVVFMVTPCINDIKHFNVQTMHTTLKTQSY
jgi:hypothetical protein